MTQEEIIEIAKTSPALKYISEESGAFAYPKKFNEQVPFKVKLLNTVSTDFPFLFPEVSDIIAIGGNEYYCWVNNYGALSVILPCGNQIGLKPSEFEVIEYHT